MCVCMRITLARQLFSVFSSSSAIDLHNPRQLASLLSRLTLGDISLLLTVSGASQAQELSVSLAPLTADGFRARPD